MSGWIGVDLDGTLAEYAGWQGPTHIGRPVDRMLARVKRWLAEGKTVKIFTARAYVGHSTDHNRLEEFLARQEESRKAVEAIQDWCLKHVGQILEVTCTKDFGMVELWDDRAVQVYSNTGLRADGQP